MMKKLGMYGMLVGLVNVVGFLGLPLSAFPTVGWETGDMVLDFWLNLESRESTVLVDKVEVGEPFFAELTWVLNAQNCLLHVKTSPGGVAHPPPPSSWMTVYSMESFFMRFFTK